MPLPKSLTTVTTLSKTLAMILFITLPFIGFYIGTEYGEKLTPPPTPMLNNSPIISTAPTNGTTTDWQTLNTNYGFSIKYPPTWLPNDESGSLGDPSGIIIKTVNLTKNDKGEIQKGAYLYGPYTMGLMASKSSLDDIFPFEDPKKNLVTNIAELMLDGQPAKKGIITKNNNVEIYVAFQYPQIFSQARYSYISLTSTGDNFENTKREFDQILSTFKFTHSSIITPPISCRPRPGCLDATPRCLIPETSDMCPRTINSTPAQTACTQEAKLCPDGSTVGRSGPKCKFAACPK